MNVVSFSGGKDSTAMLLKMFELGIPVDRVIRVDTSKEFPQMYEHIKQVQAIIPIEIETVKIDFDYYFSEHEKTKGKEKGVKGYGFPFINRRWCTRLKVNAINKIKRQIKGEYFEVIGIAYDERKRCKQSPRLKYPLVDLKMTEADCLQYCYARGFTWGGLYEKMQRVSCWCCPFSNMNELRTLYKDFPNLWSELEQMQEKSRYSFKKDYTVHQLTERFKNESRQLNLF